jgi:hypothetical protein
MRNRTIENCTITNNKYNLTNTVTMKKTILTTAMVIAMCVAPFAKTSSVKSSSTPTTYARDKKDLGSGDGGVGFTARDKKDLGSGDGGVGFTARDKKDLGSGDGGVGFTARDKKDLGSGDGGVG